MNISYTRAIRMERGDDYIHLDPKRIMDHAIVTHGHADHLKPGALMTPPTLDIMKVRKGKDDAQVLGYNKRIDYHGFEVMFRNAGHVLGSAMVKVEDVLYTGDFNPDAGIIHERAVPCPCDTLIVEATYGKPNLTFPSRTEVIEDMLQWAEGQLPHGPVVMCGYELGKAQELIALFNKLDTPVFVPENIGEISDIYRSHGIGLSYSPLEEMDDHASCGIVIPQRMLKHPRHEMLQRAEGMGAKFGIASGWCISRNFPGMDAQFPLSDHPDYDSLMWFISQCRPRKVLTVHGAQGSDAVLAECVSSELGIPAETLEI